MGHDPTPAELLAFLKHIYSLMKAYYDLKLWRQVANIVGQTPGVRFWGITTLLSDLFGALSGYTGLSGVSLLGTKALGVLGAGAEIAEEVGSEVGDQLAKTIKVDAVLETTVGGSKTLAASEFFGGLLSVVQFFEGFVGSLELMGPRFDPCTDWTEIHRIKAASSLLKMLSGAFGVAAVFSTATIVGMPAGTVFGIISAATGIAAAILDIWVAFGWGLDRGGVH